MDVQLKRGMLEALVLSAISRGESYGYKIISDVAPYIDMSESTLYPILKRLEKTGMVTVRTAEHNGRLRKYYKVTGDGRLRIREFLADMDEFLKVHAFIKGGADE